MGSACGVMKGSQDPSKSLSFQQNSGRRRRRRRRRKPYECRTSMDGDEDNHDQTSVIPHPLQQNRSSRSSSNRRYRSNSSSGNDFVGLIVSSQQNDNKHHQFQYDGVDSSPAMSDSFNFSHYCASLTSNEVSDREIMHSEQSLQKSGTFSRQESGRSISFGSIGSISKRSTMGRFFMSKEARLIEPQLGLASSGVSDSTEHSYNMHSFADLLEMSLPSRNSRWSNMDISSMTDAFVDRICHKNEDLSFKLYMEAMHQEYHHPISHREPLNCDLCLKATSWKSPSHFSRISRSKELPVVSVLECGHIFHAECLEHATALVHIHDPPCPRCEFKLSLHVKTQKRE